MRRASGARRTIRCLELAQILPQAVVTIA